jgi:hypothetical protein
MTTHHDYHKARLEIARLKTALRDAVAALGGIKSDNVPSTVRIAVAPAEDQEDDEEEYLPPDLDDPDFGSGGRVHNWRNYVGERTEAVWSTFTREQKIALYKDADDRAGNENWD